MDPASHPGPLCISGQLAADNLIHLSGLVHQSGSARLSTHGYRNTTSLWVVTTLQSNFCLSNRLLRTQSLEWFYNNVKSRFKRFGSAKVLKNLYRKHRLESGACFDILGTTVPTALGGVGG